MTKIIWKSTRSNGYSVVQRDDDKLNYMDKDGNILLPHMWLRSADNFYWNRAIISRDDNLFNIIDNHGNVISKEWFQTAQRCYGCGCIRVTRTNGDMNVIKPNGRFLHNLQDIVFVDYSPCLQLIRVKSREGKWNFITKTGRLISPSLWFLSCCPCYSNYTSVQREDGLWNIINIHGDILCPNIWFKNIIMSSIYDNYCFVQFSDEEKWTALRFKTPSLYINQRFDFYRYSFLYGCYLLEKDSKLYFIDKEKNLLHRMII